MKYLIKRKTVAKNEVGGALYEAIFKIMPTGII